MRTEDQIKWAIYAIARNVTLTYGYREDCIAVLQWVLGGEPFDGLAPPEGATFSTLSEIAIVRPMPADNEIKPDEAQVFIRATPGTIDDVLFPKNSYGK